MTVTCICSIAIANKWLKKQDGVHFVVCPKQGDKIQTVVPNCVCI